jgi:cytochrome c oxidase cbb3-type subunit 3
MSDALPPAPDSKNVDPLDTGHDYDGIREHDNRLPNWWLFTLFAAIIFGYTYYLYYHVSGEGPSSAQQYRAEMQEAAEKAEALARSRGAVTDDVLLALASNPEAVEKGGAVFKSTCVACHGPQGQGLIGPNLTDDYWLHGGKPTDILKTVTNGVADKGMPSWGPVLGGQTVENVVAYLLTNVKGKHVKGKEPQGELVTAMNDVPTKPSSAGVR